MLKRLFIFLAVMVCVVGIGRWAIGGSALASDKSSYDVAAPHAETIPSQALRLRIIANSDSPNDQATKRDVRDAIVMQVAGIVKGASSAADARARVTAALPELQATALKVVEKDGYHYSVAADVGKVPFPTKVYGNQVYPAGTYEALRITLGSGQGQNWWCVLFPPLCFVDITDGDAVPNTGQFPDMPALETIQVPGTDGQQHSVQVRLASVDYGESVWKSVKNLFHHAS